jgi:DNA-binding transcriptional LysR family regulator
MRQRLDWGNLHLILTIGREGSLSGAARVLALDHSTIHRRLGRLESGLGVCLFDRSRTGYVPTPAGEEVLALAARLDGELGELELRLAGRDQRPSGRVRVTTNDTLLVCCLAPVFANLRREHPAICVDVVSTATDLDPGGRDAEVAVRITAAPPEHLVGRKIGMVETAAYAAPGLSRPPDAAGIDWIGYGEGLAHLRAARWLEAEVPLHRIVHRVDTVLAARQAALAGMAAAVLPDFAAAGLERLDPSPMDPFQAGLWVLTHTGRRSTARVRVVMDFLARALPAALADARGGR